MTPTPIPRAWLDLVAGRSQALCIDGPAGVGKTHLWRELLERADGYRILCAQPGQAEKRLVGSALVDLCGEVTDDEIGALPPLLAAALRTALLRGSEEAVGNPHLVGVAFTALLRRLAEDGPLLVCVDDVQWLDAQTVDVLSFAARRLAPVGVGLLLTLRTELGVAAPDLVAALDAAVCLTRWSVPPLDAAGLTELVRDRLGARVPARIVRAAVGASGGNPLYCVEVAREMIARRAATDEVELVRLPDSLAELVGRHVTALPEPTRLCLAAAAALGRPTLRALRELGIADDLDAAERAGLIRVDGHVLRFTHPLYAAAAYDTLAGGERMRLHARLAPLVDGPEEHARHRALGADGPDESVAAALDTAREAALRRGALAAALDAGKLSVRATPLDSPHLASRRTRLGQLLVRAGESDRARQILREAADGAVLPHDRARALHALARVVHDTVNPADAVPLEHEALLLADGDVDLLADIHMGLAFSANDDALGGTEHGRAAVEMLARSAAPDPHRQAEAISALLGPQFNSGQGADLDACRRAIELQAGDTSVPVSDRAASTLFYLQMLVDDFADARCQLEVVRQMCLDEGDEWSRCYVLAMAATVEVRSGRWVDAERLIDECVELSELSQNDWYTRLMTTHRQWLAAYRGDLDQALLASDKAIAHSVETGSADMERGARGLRGFCQLARDDWRGAVADLERYWELLASRQFEPGVRYQAGDYLEALVGAGRLEDAERVLAELDTNERHPHRTAMFAGAARGEALLRAAQGDLEAALAAAERSIALYDQIERRFERARAVLAKGQIHRRAKQKALARQELTAALAAFEELGAAGFAAKARAELSRVGVRPPASQDLTETERKVAILTARGMTSAEIGASLFLSTKTVSANLTRIYRKLNVRNRTEFTAQFGAALAEAGRAEST